MPKTKTKKPARRNIIHRHARLRTGAGLHKTHRVKASEAVSEADWDLTETIRMEEMTLAEFREEHSINNGTDMLEALENWCTDSVVPALCRHGCEVEPDGQCEHSCPSILVRMGFI